MTLDKFRDAFRDSDNERAFDTRWAQLGGPRPHIDYLFHPTRKWELDRAWPEIKVAVEIDGGGHKMYWKKYHNDIEKQNAAHLLGWQIFRITNLMIRQDDVDFYLSLKTYVTRRLERE